MNHVAELVFSAIFKGQERLIGIGSAPVRVIESASLPTGLKENLGLPNWCRARGRRRIGCDIPLKGNAGREFAPKVTPLPAKVVPFFHNADVVGLGGIVAVVVFEVRAVLGPVSKLLDIQRDGISISSSGLLTTTMDIGGTKVSPPKPTQFIR